MIFGKGGGRGVWALPAAPRHHCARAGLARHLADSGGVRWRLPCQDRPRRRPWQRAASRPRATAPRTPRGPCPTRRPPASCKRFAGAPARARDPERSRGPRCPTKPRRSLRRCVRPDTKDCDVPAEHRRGGRRRQTNTRVGDRTIARLHTETHPASYPQRKSCSKLRRSCSTLRQRGKTMLRCCAKVAQGCQGRSDPKLRQSSSTWLRPEKRTSRRLTGPSRKPS